MKQCKECGSFSTDDTVFCSMCGTKFLTVSIREDAETAENSDNNLRVQDTEKFVGQNATQNDSALAEGSSVPSNSSTTKIIAITAFVVVAIIAVGVVISTIVQKSLTVNESTGYNKPESGVSIDSNNDYLFPSDKQYLTKDQLNKLSKDEIALLRNEIYARHGYVFKVEEYKRYFEAKSWYKPNSNFNESMFNSVEKANKDLIVEYEIEKGWR